MVSINEDLGEAAHGATPVADTDAAPAQKKRKSRGIRFESGRAKCGHVDRGEKILSDFEVDVAIRIFWEKRGQKPPTATMAGVTPSATYFMDDTSVSEALRGYRHRRSGTQVNSDQGAPNEGRY